ncbi:hypothetical protein G6F68_018182 [Rhizopus microsporus]|nr:hypothetical protein G6F68_018182 [Rhizopus microsporus]
MALRRSGRADTAAGTQPRSSRQHGTRPGPRRRLAAARLELDVAEWLHRTAVRLVRHRNGAPAVGGIWRAAHRRCGRPAERVDDRAVAGCLRGRLCLRVRLGYLVPGEDPAPWAAAVCRRAIAGPRQPHPGAPAVGSRRTAGGSLTWT